MKNTMNTVISGLKMEPLIIVDDFLLHGEREEALKQLREQGLKAFEERRLPGVVNHGHGRPVSLRLPVSLASRLMELLGEAGDPGEGSAAFPAMMSRGDVGRHRDLWNGRPGARVHGYTIIIWLSAGGARLILEGHEQHVVDAVPGRLVAFQNGHFQHAVEGCDAVRTMLGPMACRDGSFKAVMDVQSPIFRTESWSQFCCCWCFLCCVVPCVLAAAGGYNFGGLCILFLLRFIFATVRAALVSPFAALYVSLLSAATALYWTPWLLMKCCRGLRSDRWLISLATLLLLPLRAPLVLLISFLLIFLSTFLWILFATMSYEDESWRNLMLGGVLDHGHSSGVLGILHKILEDFWMYHRQWEPSLRLFRWRPRRDPSARVIGFQDP